MPAEKRLVPLTLTDLYNLRVAVNLRLEASDENDEQDKVRLWERLLKKLNDAIEKAESE